MLTISIYCYHWTSNEMARFSKLSIDMLMLFFEVPESFLQTISQGGSHKDHATERNDVDPGEPEKVISIVSRDTGKWTLIILQCNIYILPRLQHWKYIHENQYFHMS